jgi:hypothetical protein
MARFLPLLKRNERKYSTAEAVNSIADTAKQTKQLDARAKILKIAKKK